MGITLFVVTIIIAIIGLVTLAAVGGLVLRFDGLAEQIAKADDDNKLQHRIDRDYIGNALIEQKVLPLLGYKKPERSAFEKTILSQTASDPDFQ
jgi:hypothetical protein